MNIIENLKWRYAVKKFDDNKLLSKNQIDILKEAFNLTATSYGLQTISLVVVQNKDIQQQLVEHSMNQQQVVQASHLLVLCIPKNFSTDTVETYFNRIKEIRNTEDEVLNPFKEYLINDLSNRTPEQIYNWNKNQAYIALGNLLTVCATQQIDSCPMEGFVPEKYDDILNLTEKNLQSVLVLPVGYRAEDDYMKDLKKVRKPITEAVIDID